MNSIDLNGNWTLQFGPQRQPAAEMKQPDIPADWPSIAAQVPGNVELDLIRADLLPEELERGHNIYLLRDLETHQWWYSRSFNVPETAVNEPCEIVLEGVDTLATVWLNGEKIGQIENMLIPHRLNVTDHLLEGDNKLVIGIDSTVLAANQQPVAAGTWAMENNWESLSIRKAAHGFGWDIMPRVISAGLWRDIYVQPLSSNRFRDVYLATSSVDAKTNSASFIVRWDLATAESKIDDWSVHVTVTSDDGQQIFHKQVPTLCAHGQAQCDLENVELWWPRGYGAAKLYQVQLELIDESGAVQAEWSTRYGFRTIRLDKTECTDADGNGEFAFVVNGEKIFVKGTNWVPLDALHSRDAARLEETTDLLADLNCNMVRCWGGNVYESAAFFRRCDEAGVMVWQDFAFACALYPQTPEFHAKVREEAATIIPLLRNHTSLALWAGNNEIDAFYPNVKPGCDPNVDDQISRTILATACRQLDPWRDYLPSSPYYGPELWAKGAPIESRPEDHLWGPRDDFKGPFYMSSNAHFVSEVGYHGCPDRSSLEKMMTAENLWPWQKNEEWLTHAVRPVRTGTAYNHRILLMAHQTSVLFGDVPTSFEDFIFASQFSQAEALKFFIERFRIGKGHRRGILWWNVKDGWPQISDAVVDYYGAKKLAYHVIKRIQQDVCLMVNEPEKDQHAVVAVNDTRDSAAISFSVRSGDDVLLDGEMDVPAGGKANLGYVPTSSVASFYEIEWHIGSDAFRNHYLAGPRPFSVNDCRSWYASQGLGCESDSMSPTV